MNIVGIGTISFLVGVMVSCIAMLIICWKEPDVTVLGFKISIIIGVAVWIGSIFIGIDMNTKGAKTFIASYEAEKFTIEQSLNADALTGFERIELVKLASELNGELAARKEKSTFWTWVYFEKGIYDNVEFIDLGRK